MVASYISFRSDRRTACLSAKNSHGVPAIASQPPQRAVLCRRNKRKRKNNQSHARPGKELDIERIKSEYYLRLADHKESANLHVGVAHSRITKFLGERGASGAGLCNLVARTFLL